MRVYYEKDWIREKKIFFPRSKEDNIMHCEREREIVFQNCFLENNQ